MTGYFKYNKVSYNIDRLQNLVNIALCVYIFVKGIELFLERTFPKTGNPLFDGSILTIYFALLIGAFIVMFRTKKEVIAE